MADIIQTAPEREREVVVSDSRGNGMWVVLGIVLVLLVLWFFAGSFGGNDNTNTTPGINTETQNQGTTTPGTTDQGTTTPGTTTE